MSQAFALVDPTDQTKLRCELLEESEHKQNFKGNSIIDLDWHIWFTTVPFKPLSDHRWCRYRYLSRSKLSAWKPKRKILWKNYKPYLWCPFLKEKLEFATNSDPSSSLQNPSSHWSVREQPGSELGVSHPAPLGLEIASSACPFSPSPRTWIYSTLS